jgi:hypothetical protein
LDDATGNETAMSLAYTVNKATSGDDTGFLINKTDTLSQGVSRLIDVQVGGVTQFNVQDDGVTNLGNFSFDTDQTVGVGQDNYVLTYDDGTGLISLEAASGGGPADGTVTDSMLRWSGSAWVEDTRWRLNGTGGLTVYDATFADTMTISHDGTDVLMIPSVNTQDLMLGDEVGTASQWANVKIPGPAGLWVYDVTPSTHGMILSTNTSNGADYGTITPRGAGGIVFQGDNFYFNTGGNSDRFIFSRTNHPNGTFTQQSLEFRTDNVSIGWDHIWRTGANSNQIIEHDIIQQDAIGAGLIQWKILDNGLNRVVVDFSSTLTRDLLDLYSGMGLRIRDSLNADYAEFHHDGTDFNTDFTNTTDWNISGITNADFEAGAALRFYDSTDARTFTISRQLNEINLVASEAGDTMKFSGCQNYEYNKDVSGNTDVIIGEPSTVYAANSTAFISLYGESSSTKYGARFQVGGDTMVLLNAYGNMSHFLCGLPFEVNGHVYVRDGSAFRIYNSFDTDYAEFSHDGTDFNTAFTNTADWNMCRCL